MAVVVGIKFKKTGKIYDFDAGELELQMHDRVVVETVSGLEMGEVSVEPREIADEEIVNALKPVVRKADEADLEREAELEKKEADALAECVRLVEKLNLPMKPLSTEYSLEGNRLTVYFSAAERVDFRELVRELARQLKVRVEMRQTGPRDEARIVGGCGRCGRELCCASFLSDFAPVAMRMAKDQGLPLNPMKISGCCGRLMCCLVYENEQYREMKKILPKNGQMVFTVQGEARVIGTNPIKETVMVVHGEQAPVEVALKEISNEPIAPEKVAVSEPPAPPEILTNTEQSKPPERRRGSQRSRRTAGQKPADKPADKPSGAEKTEGAPKAENSRSGRPPRRQRNRRRNSGNRRNNSGNNDPAAGNSGGQTADKQ